MSIVETEAVVLSYMPYGETSKIIRVFSKGSGKLSFIAKGSRKLKNRFGGSLDPLNHVNLVYYYKEKRDLHTLTQCDIIDPFVHVKSDFDKLALGLAIAEVISKLVVEEEENVPLFDLVQHSLEWLESANKNYENIYWYFMTRFVRLSGYGFHINDCACCGNKIKNGSAFFSLAEGGVTCSSCTKSGMNKEISPESVHVLKAIFDKTPTTISNLRVSQKSSREINDLIDSYFKFHFDGYSSIQALKLMN
jgi:DNA repair protein RecO (recombination protein O)